MPFKSKAQQRWMFANKPSMAERWADHTPDIKALPEKKGSLDLVLAKMAELDKGALAAWQRPENAPAVAQRTGVNPMELENVMAKQQIAKATGAAPGPSELAQERASIIEQNRRLEQMRTAPKAAPKAAPPPVEPHPGAALRQKGFVPDPNARPVVESKFKPSRIAPPGTLSEIQGGPTHAQLHGTKMDRVKEWWNRMGVGKKRTIKRVGGGAGVAGALGLGGLGLYHLLSENEKGASVMQKTAEQIANEVMHKVAAGPVPAWVAGAKQNVQQGMATQRAQSRQLAANPTGGVTPTPPPPIAQQQQR
jgi:hypothetical protein